MAKKRAARGEFNMSLEIRALLEANPQMSGREVVEALQAKFPGTPINENSCNVAFSNARRKLGLRKAGRSTVVRRPKPAKAAKAPKTPKAVVVAAAAAVGGNVSLDSIRAACDLLAKAGSTDAAISIIKSLQILNKG